MRTEWRLEQGEYKPVVIADDGTETPVTWAAQAGSQQAALSCPITEVLLTGTRGPGKSDTMLMDFAQHVGHGFGGDWNGIIFRRTFPELKDIINKSRKWFPRIWPRAKFNASQYIWTWPTGEMLSFRQFNKPADYWKYHGHSYPFIGWDELTTWPTDECFKSMFSCSRSARPGMPRKIRSTTNPYGVGHNWCKARYRLPVKPGRIVGEIITDSKDEAGQDEPARVAIHGYLDENKILMLADPGYKQRLRAAARNPSELKAWLEGSWDIVAGGMIDDVWDAKIHVIEPFRVPDSWIIERAFDWGSTKPFSLAWWAESDGTVLPDGRVFYRGTKIRIAEWYGWNKKPNEGLKMLAVEIARQGLEMERHMKYRVQAGPADPSIFAAENGVCIADDMARMGMGFKPADAGPGSRKNGAERVRKYLKASMKHPMEEPGLFVFNTCSQFIRTVPVIPRDDKDPEDVATESEDHIWDETRYEIMFKRPSVSMPKLVGV